MFLRKKKATKRETAGVVIKKGKQKKKKKGRRLTRNRFSLWILRFTSILEGSSSCLRLCGPITKANDSSNLLPWCAQFPWTLHLTRARPQVSLDNLISTRTWTCCCGGLVSRIPNLDCAGKLRKRETSRFAECIRGKVVVSLGVWALLGNHTIILWPAGFRIYRSDNCAASQIISREFYSNAFPRHKFLLRVY